MALVKKGRSLNRGVKIFRRLVTLEASLTLDRGTHKLGYNVTDNLYAIVVFLNNRTAVTGRPIINT